MIEKIQAASGLTENQIDEFWEGEIIRKRHRFGLGNLATPSWERLQLEKPLRGLQQPSQVKLKDDPAKTKPY